MRTVTTAFLAAFLPAIALSAATWAADPANGRSLFEGDCAECHTLRASDPAGRGPHLENLFARRYGAVEGFEYRMVWTEADPTWTSDTLSDYLSIHGRVDGTDKADLIEYLKQATPP